MSMFRSTTLPQVKLKVWPLFTIRRGPLRQWGICIVKNLTEAPNG